MARIDIINKIGTAFLTSNIEKGEFSYKQAFSAASIDFDSIKIKSDKTNSYHTNIDLRFEDNNNKFVVLVETKQNFDKGYESAKNQLSAYMTYEKILTNYEIIGILANTSDKRIRVWKNSVTDQNFLQNETVLKSFKEYLELIKPKHQNNRELVMKNTYELNELLHEYGIGEKLRGQFVGTCLLAIKNNLVYKGLNTKQISAGIKSVLEKLLDNDLNKAGKLSILGQKIIDSQEVRALPDKQFEIILDFIKDKIYPFINDKSTLGQDLLNLFFTTFNKYVGKSDKNQAFTPDHIVEFMCKVIGINRNSRVLDPCCGSGSFLVRALTDALDDCNTEEEKNEVKKNHIYGIEYEETAYGLSTTNMLIHGDGNSNIINDSCFKRYQWIRDAQIDKVLMNPPYNAQKKHCKEEYVKTWTSKQKEDPSKGFHFVYEIAEQMKTGKLAVLLPMQCAIGTSRKIKAFKEKMLQSHHLDAVFSFPDDVFHPGAKACACCMIFDIGIKHEKAPIKETFFGYFKDDGFQKRKNLGRVEREDGIWKSQIEPLWLDLYRRRKEVSGLSINKEVKSNDEWLAEAYMDTDYSNLSQGDFQQTVNDYCAFLVKNGSYPTLLAEHHDTSCVLSDSEWKEFKLSDLFKISGSVTTPIDKLEEYGEGKYPYVTTQAVNNGVESFYNYYTEEGECLTVDSAVLGYCSYQCEKFSASDHVEVLRPKYKFNKYIAMFLVTIMNKEQYRYSYGRKCSQTKLKSTILKLPAITKEDGTYEPDWKYMENYIKSLPYGDRI